MSNVKQALLTMGEYIRTTYPYAQTEKLRYDQRAIFVAANLAYAQRKRERQPYNELDMSLNSVKEFKRVKVVCECRFCDGKYYMVTWKGRDESKWPNKEGSCIFCVTLRMARIAIAFGRDNDPELITKLKTKCETPYAQGLTK